MVPTVVAHYRLLDSLGEGGMGVVFRAEDLRLGREVAVKLLRTDAGTSAEWLARFEREARLASSLQHPHICTIHELGEHEGQPFIAMERLEGRTVRQLIESGPLPVRRVLDFARQVADALDAAHRRGIIHRDIKPANLFITHGDHLKVLDFGLAKSTADEAPAKAAESSGSTPTVAAAERPDLTEVGLAVGTAPYMSPEQAVGETLDPRSDLFSVGCVLYEMVTGRRAFGGDDVAAIRTRIVNGILVAPRMIDPAIPERVEAIIKRLMAVNPAERYQSAAELLTDVRAELRALDGEEDASTGAPVPQARGRDYSQLRWLGAAIVVAALFTGYVRFGWFHARPAPLSDRDSLLVGAFENTTGDAVFDNTLLTALKVQLGQSPFLDIVTDQRVAETLRLMGQTGDVKLTHAVAREVCQRMSLKAMLEGSIAALGTSYVLRLEATDCQTGEPLAREQRDVTGQGRVLPELGTMSSRMRTTLGESLPSIQRFDVPIEQATTPSLTALKAYTLGLEERRHGRELESVAFFNQAIELDREFASAYATVSTVYGSLGEWRRSEDYARQAYERRARVSERERLFVTYQYHDRVTANEEEAIGTLELWKTAYPRDVRPANALALIYNRTGQYDRAEAEAREALRRSPGHPFPLSNLALAYRSLGRYADAKKVADEAVGLGVETVPTRRVLYQLGVLANDGTAAAHVEWAKGRPREFDLVSAQAEAAGYEGRLHDAKDLYRRATDMALARGLRGTASGHLARLAWLEALYEEDAKAGERLPRVLAAAQSDPEDPDTVLRFRAAAALARAGLTPDALAFVTRAEQRYPTATFVRTVLAPVTRAAVALRAKRPEAALEALRAASNMEIGTVAGLVPIFLRGEALAATGAFDKAIAEFTRVIQHRGVDPFAPIVPLAQLGIARAQAGAGDAAAAKRSYEALFTTWAHADADLPPLVAARAEHARLISTGTSQQ
jgi:tetratricopeptide (TPR) repeat protein